MVLWLVFNSLRQKFLQLRRNFYPKQVIHYSFPIQVRWLLKFLSSFDFFPTKLLWEKCSLNRIVKTWPLTGPHLLTVNMSFVLTANRCYALFSPLQNQLFWPQLLVPGNFFHQFPSSLQRKKNSIKCMHVCLHLNIYERCLYMFLIGIKYCSIFS